MTIDDATPESGTLTRRELRASTGATETVRPPALPSSDTGDTPAPDADGLEPVVNAGENAQAETVTPEAVLAEVRADDVDTALVTDSGLDVEEPTASAASTVQWAGGDQPATAFTWLDVDSVEESTRPADLDQITMRETGPDLLADARLRPALMRARWMVPIGAVAGLALAYSATVLMWPLHEVPPTVEATEFETVASQIVTPVWPATGSAGVGIAGLSSVASSADAVSIASVTKVVTALMVLDRMPLQLGEQGPEFAFSYSDSVEYWDYRRADQSALDVPVDGVLTEYQLLQGTLLGSANNYVDRLARDIWGSDASFAEAAAAWLADRGLTGITIVTPSGFDEGNVATPEALLQLGERAMQNPVFAEIVGTVSAEIPGAGLVTNTNGMLADPGVVGIKTGTLVGWSMLTAKDVTIGDTTVQLYAAVLNQGSDAERLAVTRSLFADAETALETVAPAVQAGTVVGTVDTLWGAKVDLVTDEDATVLLWNGASATASAALALGDQRDTGDGTGTLTVSGPLDTVDVGVSLAEDLSGPSPWWRLTHPFELLGVVAD